MIHKLIKNKLTLLQNLKANQYEQTMLSIMSEQKKIIMRS